MVIDGLVLDRVANYEMKRLIKKYNLIDRKHAGDYLMEVAPELNFEVLEAQVSEKVVEINKDLYYTKKLLDSGISYMRRRKIRPLSVGNVLDKQVSVNDFEQDSLEKIMNKNDPEYASMMLNQFRSRSKLG